MHEVECLARKRSEGAAQKSIQRIANRAASLAHTAELRSLVSITVRNGGEVSMSYHMEQADLGEVLLALERLKLEIIAGIE